MFYYTSKRLCPPRQSFLRPVGGRGGSQVLDKDELGILLPGDTWRCPVTSMVVKTGGGGEGAISTPHGAQDASPQRPSPGREWREVKELT